MTKEIMKLAQAHMAPGWVLSTTNHMGLDVRAFYRAAFNAGLEAAATQAQSIILGESHIAHAIRELKK